MIEFDNLIYLDVQKTASTYISRFLHEFCSGAPVRRRRHEPTDCRADGKLHLISCRDPLAQYRSLYGYGCNGGGSLRAALERTGMKELYDGSVDNFVSWLELVLTPSKGRLYIDRLGRGPLFDFVGLQSFRFLRLAVPSNGAPFRSAKSREDIEAEFLEKRQFDVLLRAENLNEELRAMVTTYPSHFAHHDMINRYLAVSPRRNISAKLPDIDLDALPFDILTLVQEREWLFFKYLNYKPYVK